MLSFRGKSRLLSGRREVSSEQGFSLWGFLPVRQAGPPAVEMTGCFMCAGLIIPSNIAIKQIISNKICLKMPPDTAHLYR